MSIKYSNQHFKQTTPTMQAQRGFTVLELVIALLLGVLLVAAGISLFMSSQRTALLQQQQGTMQENSIFGLSLLLQDLRHTNHNMATQNMGWHTANTGLILTAQQLPSHLNLSAEQQQLLLSWHNVSQGVYVQQSDVLSIQYAPDYVEIDQNQDGTIERVETSATDCEGMTLTPDKEQGLLTKYVLVQRYFVQKVANSSPVRYALYCDAARYAQQNATHIIGLASNAQMLIPDVELFKFRLVTQLRPTSQFRYMQANDYVQEANAQRFVVALEIGLMVRSPQAKIKQQGHTMQTSWHMLGQDIQLATSQQKVAYFREMYHQVLALRNAQGHTP